jgi:hypothetical protein
MNRRDAIARVGLLLGGTVVGADVFLSGCKKRTDLAAVGLDFSTETIGFLDEVGETILPASPGSPGAKETQIGEFMKRIVTDCYPEEYQQIFAAGIGKLKELSQKKYNEDFMNLTANQKHDLLVDVDKENKNHSSRKKYKRDFMDLTTSQKQDVLTEADWEMKSTLPAKKDDYPHYFALMKQLTLWGYFTSEPGSTKALRYLPIPGKYEGCIPYKKGDKAWSAT